MTCQCTARECVPCREHPEDNCDAPAEFQHGRCPLCAACALDAERRTHYQSTQTGERSLRAFLDAAEAIAAASRKLCLF